ncbi:hypothetical protein ES703_107218 [subsurface metagenome]
MKIYGDVGIVAYDPIEDRLQCHLCGKWFRGLGVHVVVAHGWSADDYREEFSLNRQQALICEGTREKLSRINRELGQWKHLNSQTMTKTELLEFLKGIRLAPGYKLREQNRIHRSELLRENNPMNEAEAQERSLAKLRKSWYGSERMRSISRANMLATIAKLRERNLKERRWTCPCGQAFPTREEAKHHRWHCAIARQKKPLSEGGKKTYRKSLEQFWHFLDGRQPTQGLVQEWLQQLLDKGRKPATVAVRGWALRRYFSDYLIKTETRIKHGATP